MPATRNITSSLLFSLPFIGYQPGDISYGEPALNSANLIKQTILGAPFVWPWNRAPLSETTLGASQDYVIPATDYGHLEQAWLTDPEGKSKEIEIVTSLAIESAVQRPQSCAVEMQDDTSITIRLNTIPDKAYKLAGYYQKAPVLMTSLAASWSPIPDSLSYIYDWGFLGMMAMITKDIRQPIFQQKFAAHLLGAQDGLTALQRQIFLADFFALVGASDRNRLSAQQGSQARSAT